MFHSGTSQRGVRTWSVHFPDVLSAHGRTASRLWACCILLTHVIRTFAQPPQGDIVLHTGTTKHESFRNLWSTQQSDPADERTCVHLPLIVKRVTCLCQGRFHSILVYSSHLWFKMLQVIKLLSWSHPWLWAVDVHSGVQLREHGDSTLHPMGFLGAARLLPARTG